MRLDTCITLDGRADRFASSPETLRTNVLATLIVAGVKRSVLTALDRALRTESPDGFSFERKGISVTAAAAREPGVSVTLGTGRAWDRSQDRVSPSAI